MSRLPGARAMPARAWIIWQTRRKSRSENGNSRWSVGGCGRCVGLIWGSVGGIAAGGGEHRVHRDIGLAPAKLMEHGARPACCLRVHTPEKKAPARAGALKYRHWKDRIRTRPSRPR